MPKNKIKTRSAAKKRLKTTGSGKIKMAKPCRRHLLSQKSKSKKREGKKGITVSANANVFKQSLPYAL